ncbi:hypothetical protein GOP47_0017237 [Adiantum capillus-veneris]|uniref:WW domain-containing protein n=1 Tax=Adiantum capillus-veneris TaxID=13818 RepID=A0A9D4UJX9_ADICA|nr:hypothetical protein GOP47_0017237 [Adiantum capillus-veneris]
MAAELELGLQGLVEDAYEGVGRKRGAWTSMLQKRRSCEAAAISYTREDDRILQLMMGPMDRPPPVSSAPLLLEELAQRSSTLGLQALNVGGSSLWDIQSIADMCTSSSSSPALELDSQGNEPLPSGWEKCLDLQTGSMYYLNRSTGFTTFGDPRMKLPSAATSTLIASPAAQHQQPRHRHLMNSWAPTSPSSSSDLTFEGVPPRPASSNCSHNPQPPTCSTAPPAPQAEVATSSGSPSELELDLSLSLRPSTASKKRPRLPSQLDITTPVPSLQAVSRENPCRSVNKSWQGDFSLIEQGVIASTLPGPATAPAYTSQETMAALGGSVGKHSTLVPMRAQQRKLEDLLNLSMVADYSNNSDNQSSNNNMMMMTAGCANCLMFVMLPHSGSPKCPRCGAFIDTTTSTCYSPFYSHQSPPSKKPKPAAVSLSLNLSPLLNLQND